MPRHYRQMAFFSWKNKDQTDLQKWKHTVKDSDTSKVNSRTAAERAKSNAWNREKYEISLQIAVWKQLLKDKRIAFRSELINFFNSRAEACTPRFHTTILERSVCHGTVGQGKECLYRCTVNRYAGGISPLLEFWNNFCADSRTW